VPEVTLREVDADNVRAVCKLELGEGQERFVAPAAFTVAQSHYIEGSFIRAVYAGEELVGLVAVEIDDGEWWLWRLLIDCARQSRGYGAATVAAVIEIVCQKGGRELFTCYVPGEGGPGGFYLGLGFEETGREEHGERVLRLQVATADS
jgi:diamine N-acetyltransferase